MLFIGNLFSQKIDDTDLKFNYKKLPTNPIDKKYTTYSSEVFLAYEEADRLKQEEYDKQTAEANAKFDEDKKAAAEKYQKDKQDYKSKSLGDKIIESAVLKQDNRPKQEYVGKDYIEKPRTRKVYDKDLLASTFIKFEGYNKDKNAPLKVTVTVLGFEYTPYKTNTATHEKTDTKAAYSDYSIEFEYRNPVSVKVETTDGTILLNEVVEKSNLYNKWISKTSTNLNELISGINGVLDQVDNKLIDENMKLANEYLNDHCAISTAQRESMLYNVTSKKVDYTDLNNAFIQAAESYTLLFESKTEAIEKLKSSITIWETAMKESSATDKKARINADVMLALIFNLSEAYIWSNEYSKAQNILVKTAILDLSKKEIKKVEELKLFIADQKGRFEANKGVL